MKQIKIMILSVFLMLLVFADNTQVVRADITDTTLGQEITSVTIRDSSELDTIDPALFYNIMADIVLDLKFDDGQTLELDRWVLQEQLVWDGGDQYDYTSKGYLTSPYYDYYAYLYDADGNQVFLDYDMAIGEGYVLKFYRGGDMDNPIFEQEISITAPASFGEITDGTIEFAATNPQKFEAVWYPVPVGTKLNTEYKISRGDFAEDEIWRNHVSLWKYENGQATRIDKGLQTQDQQTFAYTFTDTTNVYLVIGESNKEMNISGMISMKEKRVLNSIELNPYTCTMWDNRHYNMPVTVHYTDGSSDTYKDWLWSLDLENANGDGQTVNESGFRMTTPNGDELYLGFKDEAGNWMDIGHSGKWKAGTYTAVAYLLSDRDNCAQSTITVEEPEALELDLDKYQTEGFAVTAASGKWYKVTVTGDEKEVIIINNSSEKLYYRSFSRAVGSDGEWNSYHQEYEVDGNEKASFQSGYEYLILVSTNTEASGTIGRYERDSEVKTAEVTVEELDLKDLTIWAKLPVKINLVSSNDSSLQTGWQIVNEWEVRPYISEASAITAYGERIYYQIYKDGEPISIPSEDTLWQLGCGEYEIKVYGETVEDTNLIGSTKVATNYTHEWEEVDYIPATCSEAGEITYWCPKCRKVKREAISKKDHVYSTSWTIDKAATTTANGSKSKHCENCDEKTSVTTIKKASKVSLSTAAYVYNGKQKSPTVTVKDSAGNKIAAANYTVTKPSGRKNVGKYTYKIKFKNEYSGTKSLTLTVNPKGTSISKVTGAKKAFTVKWNKQAAKMATARITGYEIQYSASRKFTNAKKSTVSGYSSTSKKVTGLNAKKTYYVRIRTYKTVTFNGKSTKLYSGWSAVKTVKTK